MDNFNCEPQTKAKFDKRRKAIMYVAGISIIILVIAGIITYPYYKPYLQYYSAKKCLNEGKYISALEQFVDLGDFKDALELANESRYNQAKIFFENKEYDKAMPLLDLLHNYKDSENLNLEMKLIKANEKYLVGDFISAKNLLNNTIGSKDAQELLYKINLLEKYQGTWQEINGYNQMIINNLTATFVITYDFTTDVTIVKTITLTIEELMQKYPIIDGIITYQNLWDKTIKCKKRSTATVIPKPKTNPIIGMSSSEARNSTWGSPSKINKTTNKYGVSEQWVYSNNRYLYLDDGVVTSIQE